MMLFQDLSYILNWWFGLLALGIVFLPVTAYFFGRFFDAGYPFAKVIGYLFLSYFVWLAGSLHLLPFSLWSIVTGLILGIGLNIYLLTRFRQTMSQHLLAKSRIMIIEEVVFLLALVVWSWLRGFQPDIEGLEKFMDFGFINSLLRSQYFPPADMWFAGQSINYYYFGHLAAAVLTKLTNLPSRITYNLMLATLFALTLTLSFSLAGNLIFSLKKKLVTLDKTVVFGGLLSAFLVTLGGNLHPLWWWLNHGWSFKDYWYPDATRFIVEKFGAADNTIHEFPIYSFVVSDLHGHVSDIPFVFLVLALTLSLFLLLNQPSRRSSWPIIIPHLAFLGLGLGVMYMTNAWDLPIYFLVLVLALGLANYSRLRSVTQTLYQTGWQSFFVLTISFLVALPFSLNFHQIAKGIDLVRAHSPFWMLLVLWGYQWALSLGFLLLFMTQKIKIPTSPVVRLNFKFQAADAFAVILITVATCLIILPELIYVKDIYIASYHRANTMFKFVYQSFVLYGLVAGYILIRLWLTIRKSFFKFLLFTFYFLLLLSPLIYPYFAVNSYYGVFQPGSLAGRYRGLNGLDYLTRLAPDDFAGIQWLVKNVTGQPHILEAAGDSYTDYGRVSMVTGLPTVQGWIVHEWLWRGSYDEPGRRAQEVETIYAGKDLTLTKNLLSQYQVRYVFIGSLERAKYPVKEEKFKSLGQLVFAQGNTRIYDLGPAGN